MSTQPALAGLKSRVLPFIIYRVEQETRRHGSYRELEHAASLTFDLAVLKARLAQEENRRESVLKELVEGGIPLFFAAQITPLLAR